MTKPSPTDPHVPIAARQTWTTALGVVLVGLALSNCSAPGPSATPSPSLPVRYRTVVDLRNAAIAAGYECSEWEQHNKISRAAESGSCSTADVFSTYVTESDASAAAATLKSLQGAKTLVVGPNWIINTNVMVPELSSALGGTVVTIAQD